MPRGLLCCTLQFYFHGINAFGKGIHLRPRLVQLGNESLHRYGVESILKEKNNA
ncbi:hypothetical protein D3C73_1459400 [compost metagenome]